MKSTMDPAERPPDKAKFAPKYRTAQVPAATTRSTMGESLALSDRALSAASDGLERFIFKPVYLVVFACKGFYNADGTDDLLHDREHFALVPAHLARRDFSLARVAIHDKEQDGHNAQGNKREPPVDVEHDADHEDEREDVDEHAKQALHDERLDGVDVAGNAADQVAGPGSVVVRQRQLLYVGVQVATQIVRDPLADTCCEVFVTVREQCIQDGDDHHRGGMRAEECWWGLVPTVSVMLLKSQPWDLRWPMTLSRTILSGHGCRTSATLSPRMHANPSHSERRCGRSRLMMVMRLSRPESLPASVGAASVRVLSPYVCYCFRWSLRRMSEENSLPA